MLLSLNSLGLHNLPGFNPTQIYIAVPWGLGYEEQCHVRRIFMYLIDALSITQECATNMMLGNTSVVEIPLGHDDPLCISRMVAQIVK